MIVPEITDGRYRRHQLRTLDNGMPIVRSYTPTLGAFYWLAVRGADQDWYPFGGRTFNSIGELKRFARDRGWR